MDDPRGEGNTGLAGILKRKGHTAGIKMMVADVDYGLDHQGADWDKERWTEEDFDTLTAVSGHENVRVYFMTSVKRQPLP